MMFLRKGNRNRSQEPTGANELSSRSHAVLQVLVSSSSTDSNGPKIERFSKLSMIDLAGSERAAETNNRGQRMIEGANINRSLLALGNCINALIDGKRGKYVNYRDSKLTRLLKDSLGGNCRTVMISNISPSSSKFDETLNTLKYASRARNIKNKITQQVKIEEYSNAVNQMRAETSSMKVRLANNVLNSQKENSVKHNRTRTQTTDTTKSGGVRGTDNKRSAVSTAVFSEDNFYEYLDSLEINMGDQIALKNKIIEEDELEAAAISTAEQLETEIEKLTAINEKSAAQPADKRKEIESQISSKKKAINSCEQSKVEIQNKKASLTSQINEIQEKISENSTVRFYSL
jgi:kinesin family protein 18/19